MSIWFFLWLVLSLILLSFTGWTFYILYRQKLAWKRFASDYGLHYESGSFNESPKISGTYADYSIELFTGEHVQDDGRQNRKLTAIEVEVTSSLPMQGAVGSEGMADIVRNLNYPHKIKGDLDPWGREVTIKVDEPAVFQKYMTVERLKGLSDLMKVVNGWVILIFVRNQTLLRIDLPNPLEDGKKMTILLDKMVEVAKGLELAKGERRRLEALQGRELAVEEEKKIDFDEEHEVMFELEEDDTLDASADPADGDKSIAE